MIRLAHAGDEAQVVTLWRACGLVAVGNDPVADFLFALQAPASDVLVAEELGIIVAAVMVGHDGHRGWVYYVATAPSHRRRGFGRAMIAAAEVWMESRGVPKAQLMVRETNSEVVGFYERLGYSVVPRITMQKVLRREQRLPR